jgi:hypothetical protein
MKKIILLLLLTVVGCSATYRIPDGKSQADFDNTVRECELISGKKIAGFAIGNPIFVAAMFAGGGIYNAVVESKFRDCMKEKGYEVAE